MSIEYAGDGEVEPTGIYQDLRDCHQRLAAVIDEIPNDADGDQSPAAAVVEEVFAFLGAFVQELEDWSNHLFVQIEESVHSRLWKYCREQEKNFDDQGIEAKYLLRALVNTALDEAMAKPIDLERAVSHHGELFARQRLERQAEQKSDPTAGQSDRTAVAQRAGTQGKDTAGKRRKQRRPAKR